MARAMPVFPDVGSRMIESSFSRPRASRSSTRYFATRSLTEPVGFVASSFANSRTDGVGDMRGIWTSGVWPIAPRMSSYRPPCGAITSWAWACTWSGSIGSPAPAARPWSSRARRALTGSAPRHRRQEPDLVALPHRRLQPVEIADILAVDVDVDEAVELAVVGQELAAERRELADERLDDLADGAAGEIELLLAAGLGPEDLRDPDGAHACGPPRTNTPPASDAAPKFGIGSGRPAARAATASVEQTGHEGSRRSLSSVKVESRASKSSSRPASVSPMPSNTFSASLAWSMPMIPGTTPRTPATEQPGASSGGGGVG